MKFLVNQRFPKETNTFIVSVSRERERVSSMDVHMNMNELLWSCKKIIQQGPSVEHVNYEAATLF